jgi:hypothetical protein
MTERNESMDWVVVFWVMKLHSALKMEAIGSSETFVSAYKATRLHNRLDHDVIIHLQQTLKFKSHTYRFLLFINTGTKL